ncbi:MAG TPA: hypothetical protein VGQ80_21130 [Acidimicrobiia bacterium]|nr:hypothetical protein [Acidimicrobiia bacterium]
MFGSGLRWMTSMGMAGVELAVDAGRLVGADDLFDLRPRQFRRLLLTFEESIQGKIPEILGDDEEERVDTLVRLLRGTSEEDLSTLIGDLQTALTRLDRERRRTARRTERARLPRASVLARRFEEPTV